MEKEKGDQPGKRRHDLGGIDGKGMGGIGMDVPLQQLVNEGLAPHDLTIFDYSREGDPKAVVADFSITATV